MENYRAIHEKLIQATVGITPERFIEAISRIENRCYTVGEIENIALVPLEANFQLPNVFLNTRRTNKVEKLFAEHSSGAERIKAIDDVIGWLDNTQFEEEEKLDDCQDNNKQILNAILKQRFN